MLENKKSNFFILISIFIIHILWCSIKGYSRQEKREEEPVNISEEIAQASSGEKSKKYTYTLVPEHEVIDGEYQRREIESFLCACATGFIRVEDVNKRSISGKYQVKAKHEIENQKKMVESSEINKWFEDQVLVTTKGDLTVLDIETIKGFYNRINQIIGKKKFIVKPGLEAANIVILLAPSEDTLRVEQYIGETSILHDNLGVRFTSHDQSMNLHIETYKLGSGKLINESRHITLTPAEIEFRRKNRLVKVYMKNILDPYVRYFAFVHELLHSIGFTGHSPYKDSHLFPLPVRAFPHPLPLYRSNSPVLTDLAERMVEMLYRPEILPGMSLKEAREILSHLKLQENTPPYDSVTHLKKWKNHLEEQQDVLMNEENKKYTRKMELYFKLDKLINKVQWYLDEFKEIRNDFGLEANFVNEFNDATSSITKLIRIRKELIITEYREKKYRKELEKNNKNRRIKREIKRLQEEAVVLRDLLEAEKKVAALEPKIMVSVSSFAQKKAELKLRRILRQLISIDNELDRLIPMTAQSLGQ